MGCAPLHPLLPVPTYSLSPGQHLGLWRHSLAPGRRPAPAASRPAWSGRAGLGSRHLRARRRGAFSESPAQAPRVRSNRRTAATLLDRQCLPRRKRTAEPLPVLFSMRSGQRLNTLNYGSVAKLLSFAKGYSVDFSLAVGKKGLGF